MEGVDTRMACIVLFFIKDVRLLGNIAGSPNSLLSAERRSAVVGCCCCCCSHCYIFCCFMAFVLQIMHTFGTQHSGSYFSILVCIYISLCHGTKIFNHYGIWVAKIWESRMCILNGCMLLPALLLIYFLFLSGQLFIQHCLTGCGRATGVIGLDYKSFGRFESSLACSSFPKFC